MNTFLVVPQWQGSGSSRALRLRDGAEAIAAELPVTATARVAVPLGAGDAEGTGVHRLSSLRRVRDEALDALTGLDGPVITIGGDRGVELASVGHAVRRRADGLCLLWFGARAGLHTPTTSPSGAFQEMVLRTLLGEGADELVPEVSLRPDQVVLAGVRALDDPEIGYLESVRIRTLGPAGPDSADLASAELTAGSLLAAIEGTGAASVYLHIDLDVLDLDQLNGVDEPQPFGVRVDELVGLIGAVRTRFPLSGAGITGFAPSSAEEAEEDLGSILRMIDALTRTVTTTSEPEEGGSADA